MEVRYILLFPPVVEEVLFSTPLIRSLIKGVEGAEVYCAVPKGYEWLLEDNPYVTGLITFGQKPSGNIDAFKEIKADYLVDLTGSKGAWGFKNRLKIMDFTLAYREIIKSRAETDLAKAFDLFRGYSFDALRVFDIEYDGKGMDFFYGHNKTFIENAIPGSFLDGYAVIDLPDETDQKIDINGRLSDLISRIERPVVLCGDKKWRATGEEVMRRTGCTILSTCGDFTDMEKVFARAGARVLINIKQKQEIWAMIFDKPHFYFDINEGAEMWRTEIDEIRKLVVKK